MGNIVNITMSTGELHFSISQQIMSYFMLIPFIITSLSSLSNKLFR